MNADSRRWIGRSLVIALLGSQFATHAGAEELRSELGAEIERRFEESPIEVDVEPLKFGFQFSEYVSSRAAVYVTNFIPGWLILPPVGSARLEEPASLPRPTLVEQFIAKGFPSGELSGDASVQDDSYLFAREVSQFRGVGFSR